MTFILYIIHELPLFEKWKTKRMKKNDSWNNACLSGQIVKLFYCNKFPRIRKNFDATIQSQMMIFPHTLWLELHSFVQKPCCIFRLLETSDRLIQVNNYEIVVNFFQISHNLTWYSAIVHTFTRIYPVCSNYELTK